MQGQLLTRCTCVEDADILGLCKLQNILGSYKARFQRAQRIFLVLDWACWACKVVDLVNRPKIFERSLDIMAETQSVL